MRRVVAICSGLWLGGCVTDEPPPMQISPALAAAIESQDEQKCLKLGAQPGTEAYTNCRLKLQEFRRQDEANQQAAFERQQDRKRQAFEDLGNALGKPTPLPVLTRPKTTTTSCDTNVYGRTLSTDCRSTTY